MNNLVPITSATRRALRRIRHCSHVPVSGLAALIRFTQIAVSFPLFASFTVITGHFSRTRTPHTGMVREARVCSHQDEPEVTSEQRVRMIFADLERDIGSRLAAYSEEACRTETGAGLTHEVGGDRLLATPLGLRAVFTLQVRGDLADIEVTFSDRSIEVVDGDGAAGRREFTFEPDVALYEVTAFLCTDRKLTLDVIGHHVAGGGVDERDGVEGEGGEDTEEVAEVTQKVGQPYFFGEDGTRYLRLLVDIGLAFSPKEITVQILKDNIIQVSRGESILLIYDI